MGERGPSRQELIRRLRRSNIVGRQEEREAFADALEQQPSESSQFLFHIRGPGGVGKSTLARQLESEARRVNALTAYVDELVADVIEAMEAIGAQFAQQGLELKEFERRLATYRQRRHEADVSMGLGGGAAQGGGTEPGAGQPSATSLVGSQIALTGLGMLPVVGAFTGALDPGQVAAGADRFKALLSARFRSHEDAELVLSPLQALTPVFLRGLEEAAARRPWVVLFFDTYERTGPLVDSWLRDILVSDRYGQLPANVLVVLAGQPRLDPRCWGDWLDLVTDLPLDVFTEDEARRLVAAKGVVDEEIVDVILESSGRLPVLVSMLAQARPSSVADVGDPSDSAVERFLKWETNPVRRKAALDCALPQEIDEETYRWAVDEEAREEFGWLRTLTFFIYRSGRGHYHDVVRSVMLRMQRQQSPARWKARQTRLADGFAARRAELESGAAPADGWWADERWRNHRLQETYHRLCADPRAALPGALRELLDAQDHALPTLRRWVQTLTLAGRDADAGQLRTWGRDLTAALDEPSPRVAVAGLLLERCELSPEDRCLAHTVRGWAHRRGDAYEEALADYTASLEIEPSARAYRGRGETYRLMGRYEEALADFDRALGFDPDKAWTLANRGRALDALGRREEALADFDSAVRLQPNTSWYLTLRGHLLRTLTRYEESLADLTRAVRITPRGAWTLGNRGETLRLMGRHEEALADFDRAIEVMPEYAWALCSRGQTLYALDRYEEAVADFNRALGVTPDYDWVLANRGRALDALGRYEEALADFDRAIALNPGYRWAIGQRAKTLESLARYDEALADFDRALAAGSDMTWCAAHRGWLMRLLGRYEEALADFERVLRIAPDNLFAVSNRAVTCRVLGRYDEALADLRRLLDQDPGNGWLHYEISVVLHALDDPLSGTHALRCRELCTPPAGELPEDASDAGNLVLVSCLQSRWSEADAHVTDFLALAPRPGRRKELHTVLGTLAPLLPSEAAPHLAGLRSRLS